MHVATVVLVYLVQPYNNYMHAASYCGCMIMLHGGKINYSQLYVHVAIYMAIIMILYSYSYMSRVHIMHELLATCKDTCMHAWEHVNVCSYSYMCPKPCMQDHTEGYSYHPTLRCNPVIQVAIQLFITQGVHCALQSILFHIIIKTHASIANAHVH